jgi:hypothetical protein
VQAFAFTPASYLPRSVFFHLIFFIFILRPTQRTDAY